MKPNAEGSSVGLALTATRAELAAKLAAIDRGGWLIEQRIVGREFSIGVLNGRATAADVLELVRRVRARVRAARGVELQPEVLLFGRRWEEVL